AWRVDPPELGAGPTARRARPRSADVLVLGRSQIRREDACDGRLVGAVQGRRLRETRHPRHLALSGHGLMITAEPIVKPTVRLIQGDCLEVLKTLDAG